ncbi:DUF2306 domain-containing protein [Actinophytocola sp.]|uniref:DUF2306 domain-containing protein n=1 Tax=Actinophytocola sp. TaxID=1872138 RepID=UPI002ED0C3C2
MTTRTQARPQWRVPTALILLSAVPVAAGTFRVAQLTGGARITEENARFFAAPVPVVLHIVGATVFCVLGAFQFVPRLRRRAWHRVAGRVLVPSGLVAALAGLWLTVFFPNPGSYLLNGSRLVFGSFMVAALVVGLAAIRRRNVAVHRAWMRRGYAIGLGAGTQAVVTGIWFAAAGTPSQLAGDVLLIAGWVINLAVAEWLNLKEKR